MKAMKVSSGAGLILIILVLSGLLTLLLGFILGSVFGLTLMQNLLEELASILLISGTVTFLMDYLRKVEADRWLSFVDQIYHTGLVAIYPSSDSANMKARILDLIGRSKDIRWVGTAIMILADDEVLDALLGKAQRGEAKVEIYLANPYSEAVNARLIEEEVINRPMIGRQGILNRIDGLLYAKRDRKIADGCLTVKLFNHHPTIALLAFDSEVIVYHYGYQELGNRSPVYCYSIQSNSLAHHYISQLNHIRADSVPAELVTTAKSRAVQSKAWADQLPWYAIYLVPDETSDFYRLWSDLAGYDIWAGKQTDVRPEIAPYLGDANTFGCHITLLDALGAWNQSQITLIGKELQWIAQQYSPFTMTNRGYLLEFKKRALVIGFEDASGQVESLQAEVITRFASQSVISNYQIIGHPAAAAVTPANARTQHMLQRYHTPFCLNEYHAHITILGNLLTLTPPDAAKLVEVSGFGALQAESLHFSNLCLMSRDDAGFWRVAEAVKLGK